MGEVRMRRFVASSMVMLLVLLVPVSAEEGDAVRLEIEVIDDNLKPWYGAGDTLVLASAIHNTGEATSINEDPSCGTILRIANSYGESLVDESIGCRGQSRGLDIGTGTTALDEHRWDLTDSDGSPVPPGVYSVSIELAGSGLMATTEVMVQQNANIPSELLIATSVVHRSDLLEVGEPFVVTYELHNPTAQTIDLTSLKDCQLLLDFEGAQLGPACDAGASILEPFAVVSLGHTMIQPAFAGDASLTIQTPDGLVLDTYDFTVEDREAQSVPLTANINTLSTTYAQGELFDGSLTLTNDGSENELLRFTNTCRATYWIVGEDGVAYDSLNQANCRDAELDVVVGASSQSTFPLQSWAFVDQVGCSMPSGDYVLVAEVPEFGYASSIELDFRRVQSANCGTGAAPLPSLSIGVDDDNNPLFELQLTGTAEQTDIQWIDICKASIQLWNLETTEKMIEKNVLCNDNERIDQALRLAPNDVLEFTLSDLNSLDYQEVDYRVYINLATDQDLVLEQEFTWPLQADVAQEDVVDDEISEDIAILQIDGTWNSVLTSDGACWMLEDDAGAIHMLADSLQAPWSPEHGTSGVYNAQPADATAACARFTAESYALVEVVQETPLIEEEPEVEESAAVEIDTQEEDILPDWAPRAVTVLTVSAILSMLGFAAFNNEAIRISTTLTGLWLLGFIGRTSETSDGRFQRGRLLGYLTANPGCHFRALLSALEMSNGQLSHHLRVLEQEESIWRRKDGRLVRYYPLTNTLHPLLEDEALPVPILAPDPLSLQGKILVLLDHDSQMGDFPTQAELAKRLDKSQQLISHHLRTLEKYGLIEGRRMGMRNRYKLTKEAMFLLETSDAYLKNEMSL